MTTETELRHAPPMLLAAGLLFWGWQNGFLAYALAMAALLEAANRTGWRWRISDREFNQIADLSSLVFFVVAVYVFIKMSAQGIFTILELLPFLFFLLVLAQVFSERGKIRLSTLFISMRRLEPDSTDINVADIDITLPYFLICMVSASAGNQNPEIFFIIICLLTGWLLWPVRSGRYHPLQWITSLCFAFGLAYASQLGIQQLQRFIETTALDWFDQFAWTSRDPESTMTAIGSVGRLKLSDRIMLRVETGDMLKEPLLLRDATYNSYGYGIWNNADIGFFVVDPDPASRYWILGKKVNPEQQLTISTYLADARGIIPMPHGANAIKRGTSLLQVENNPFGAVRIESKPGWFNYLVTFNEDFIHDSEPDAADLEIQPPYIADFKQLASELGLISKTEDEVIDTVTAYFRDNFYYSLAQKQRYPRGKFLSRFLFVDRKGHCEYFATATVLLLRAAGIPARYAVGYSIQEYSPWEGRYIARARHAHAWVLYYSNQGWHTLDTTPSIWAPLEAEDSSVLVPLMDLWSWLKFSFTGGNNADTGGKSSTWLIWLLIPLITFLGWRLYFSQRLVSKKAGNKASILRYERMGLDSGFYKVIQQLEKNMDPRRKGETLLAWINRIQTGKTDGRLLQAVQLHNSYRFDPESNRDSDKSELDKLVHGLLNGTRHSQGRQSVSD